MRAWRAILLNDVRFQVAVGFILCILPFLVLVAFYEPHGWFEIHRNGQICHCNRIACWVVRKEDAPKAQLLKTGDFHTCIVGNDTYGAPHEIRKRFRATP
jgi:hypothetical protein